MKPQAPDGGGITQGSIRVGVICMITHRSTYTKIFDGGRFADL